MTLSIRRAEPDDLETIVRFNRDLAWESEGKKLDLDTLSAGVRAVLADANKGFYTVAERHGQAVGQTLITVEWSDWRNGYFWWLQSVYVTETARRQGVFRAIFDHLRHAATADPTVRGFRLYVERGNNRGLGTYSALGFTDEGYSLLALYPL